ncbi:MAG: hypothetical protein ACRD26_24805 [Vicinamibacterales bacterium]
MSPDARRGPRGQEQVEVLAPDKGIFDFNVVSHFSRNYLATYYCQPPAPDECAVLSFLTREYSRITSQPCAIEIGSGPTVHHVLPIAPYVSEIHMADYLLDNLEEVRRWRDDAPGAHRWHHYTSLALRLQGRPDEPADVAVREADTRRKITRLLHCDLKSDVPLGTRRQYPAVGCFYVVENIGIAKDEWARVMKRVAELTAPGGLLFLSALRETHFYVVKSPDGRLHRYPSAFLTEQDFTDLLPMLGFNPRQTVVESARLTGQEAEGVSGVILVAALKRSSSPMSHENVTPASRAASDWRRAERVSSKAPEERDISSC